jgi:hypothetical protein
MNIRRPYANLASGGTQHRLQILEEKKRTRRRPHGTNEPTANRREARRLLVDIA